MNRLKECFIGTYAEEHEEGLLRFRFNSETGELISAGAVKGLKHPSFVTVHPELPVVYTLSKRPDSQGAVLAYRLTDDNTMDEISEQPTVDGSPCHVSVDAAGRYLFAANYGGGNVCVYPLQQDGSIGERAQHIQHVGSSVNKARQEKAHPHAAVVDPTDQFVIVPDLGMDELVIYKIDASSEPLTEHTRIKTDPGAGPRHFKFHPNGKWAYVINELANTVTLYDYDDQAGNLTPKQTVSTLPESFKGENTTAELHISPSGRHLYGSNRGHDSIAVYDIDTDHGQLNRIQVEPTGGKEPRNFNLVPDEPYLIACNQHSDSLVIFHRDEDSGKLSPTGRSYFATKPVCVAWR